MKSSGKEWELNPHFAEYFCSPRQRCELWFNKQHRCKELIAHFRCPERYKLTLNVLVSCLLFFSGWLDSFYWLRFQIKSFSGSRQAWWCRPCQNYVWLNSSAVPRDTHQQDKVHDPMKGSIRPLRCSKKAENNYYTFPESLGSRTTTEKREARRQWKRFEA